MYKLIQVLLVRPAQEVPQERLVSRDRRENGDRQDKLEPQEREAQRVTQVHREPRDPRDPLDPEDLAARPEREDPLGNPGGTELQVSQHTG